MTFLKSSMSLMDFLKMTSDLLKLNQDEKESIIFTRLHHKRLFIMFIIRTLLHKQFVDAWVF